MNTNLLFRFQINRYFRFITRSFLFIGRWLSKLSVTLRVRFWISYLLVIALITGAALFIFLNGETFVTGHDLVNYQTFIIVVISFATVLFLILLFFFHFVGLYVWSFSAFFVGLVIFTFLKWGSITFDYITFFFFILFTVFGIIWQIYFFFSFRKYSWQKVSLIKIWKFYWKDHLFVLQFYLVIFALAWVFFLFGDLGNNLLGWLSIKVERNYFSSLGRTMLFFVFLSFATNILFFTFCNWILLTSWDRFWKQHLSSLGSFYWKSHHLPLAKMKAFFSQLSVSSSNFFKRKPSFKISSPLLVNRFWIKQFAFFTFLLLVVIGVIFLSLSLEEKTIFWQKSSLNLWKKTDLSVKPLVNEYDRQSYLQYLLWELQRRQLSGHMNVFDANNFRVVPIIESSGSWTYGVEFLQPLTSQSEQFLQTNSFVKVNAFSQFLWTIWFDFRWLLISWGVALALMMFLFTILLGWEYSVMLPLGHIGRIFVLISFCFIFDTGMNGIFLKLLSFLIVTDLFCTFYLYNSYSRSQKSPIAFLFGQSKKFYFFFIFFALLIWSLNYILLGYNWEIFVPLTLVVTVIYLSSFSFNLLICQKLSSKKHSFVRSWKQRLFATHQKGKVETLISHLND